MTYHIMKGVLIVLLTITIVREIWNKNVFKIDVSSNLSQQKKWFLILNQKKRK